MSFRSGNRLNARKPIETNADLDQNYNSEHGRIKPCFLIIHNHENIRIHLFDNTDMGVRAVGKAQTNAVAFLKPDGKLIWLFWPKAKDIQIIDENTFIVTDNGRPMLKYIFVE